MQCLSCSRIFYLFENLEKHWENEHEEGEGRNIRCKIIYEGNKYAVY